MKKNVLLHKPFKLFLYETTFTFIAKYKENQKNPVDIFAFGVNDSIQIFRSQFQSLKLRMEMLNAANIYLFGIMYTKYKNLYRFFQIKESLNCML